MAWGYWSATSVSDRGRSPRRDKEKHSNMAVAPGLHHQQAPGNNVHSQVQQQLQELQQQLQGEQPQLQPQQQQPQSQQSHPAQASTAGITLSNEPLQGGSSLHMQQIQAELAAAADVPQDPCSRMMQGGSFYSYSTKPSARRPETLPSAIGVQVLPRSTANYPPSPVESDSVDYEQPTSSMLNSYVTHHQDDLLRESPPGGHHMHSSSRMKLIRDDDDIIEGLSDVDFEDITSQDVVFTTRIGQPGTSGCLLHGIPPCRMPPDPAPPLPPLLGGPGPNHPPGEPQFWFDDITWGRSSSTCWDDDDGEY